MAERRANNRLHSYEKEEFSGLGGKSRIEGKIMSSFWEFLGQSRIPSMKYPVKNIRLSSMWYIFIEYLPFWALRIHGHNRDPVIMKLP